VCAYSASFSPRRNWARLAAGIGSSPNQKYFFENLKMLMQISNVFPIAIARMSNSLLEARRLVAQSAAVDGLDRLLLLLLFHWHNCLAFSLCGLLSCGLDSRLDCLGGLVDGERGNSCRCGLNYASLGGQDGGVLYCSHFCLRLCVEWSGLEGITKSYSEKLSVPGTVWTRCELGRCEEDSKCGGVRGASEKAITSQGLRELLKAREVARGTF
jgi:hypothetical protein